MSKKANRPDYSNHPYVSNYPQLQEWLDKNEARCMWQLPMGESGSYDYPRAYVECYQIPANGRVFIVLVHADRHGWDIYTACGNMNIEATLNDADIRLNLENQDIPPCLRSSPSQV